MMTDVTVAKETMLFFQSLILGAGLSLLYDVLRIIRRETRHQAVAVSLEDIVYFLVCGMVTFGFILKDNSGQVRGYIVVGEVIGWIICHMTVGEAAVRIFVWVFDLVKRIVCFWILILISPFVWIGRRFCRLIRKIEKRLCINLKKVMQKEKYNLKRKRMMLYNLDSRFRKTRV